MVIATRDNVEALLDALALEVRCYQGNTHVGWAKIHRIGPTRYVNKWGNRPNHYIRIPIGYSFGNGHAKGEITELSFSQDGRLSDDYRVVL